MERLGDDARRLLAAAGVRGVAELEPITRAWRSSVGDAIARAAWPKRLSRDGTLHVATVSSTWAFELERLASQIKGRLDEALGPAAPAALRFAPGPVPEPDADPEGSAPEPPQVSEESRAQGRAIASSIADEELRELVARAAAASLERARSDRTFC